MAKDDRWAKDLQRVRLLCQEWQFQVVDDYTNTFNHEQLSFVWEGCLGWQIYMVRGMFVSGLLYFLLTCGPWPFGSIWDVKREKRRKMKHLWLLSWKATVHLSQEVFKEYTPREFCPTHQRNFYWPETMTWVRVVSLGGGSRTHRWDVRQRREESK